LESQSGMIANHWNSPAERTVLQYYYVISYYSNSKHCYVSKRTNS